MLKWKGEKDVKIDNRPKHVKTGCRQKEFKK